MAQRIQNEIDRNDATRPQVVLASASPTRAALLRAAGVNFSVAGAQIDEEEVKLSLRVDGADGAIVAEMLAEMKAMSVSRRSPHDLVIGADQVLECDGQQLDKPANMAAARQQLQQLRGRSHSLITCVVVCRDHQRLWHHLVRAKLEARRFSDEFLEEYLETIGDAALSGPGAYQVEGVGAQLFSRIDGDYFAILGLPLIPLLDYLRVQQVLGT